MALQGTYSVTDPPQRGGTFFNVETSAPPRENVGSDGVVGLIAQADWGPDGVITQITSELQGASVFGTGQTASFSISQALRGEGAEGASGAVTVKVYRIVGSAAAKATLTVNNTGATPALKLDAKYKGSRGNSFKVTTQTDPVDGTKRNLFIYEGTVKVESYTYASTGSTLLADLAAQINKNSNFVTATVLVDATPLAAVTSSTLASGNSGTTVTNSDYVTAMGVFEADGQFAVFALDNYDLLDSTGKGNFRDWVVRLNEEGKYFSMVVGGAAAETLPTATARSVTVDTADTAHLYPVGEVFVNIWGDVTIAGTVYSSSRMACRIAGIIASAGFSRSVSNSILDDATMTSPPTSRNIESAVRAGVIPFYKDGVFIRLQRGRTCYGTSVGTLPTQKNEDFKSLSFVMKLRRTFAAMDNMVTDKIYGKAIENDASTRGNILGMFKDVLKSLDDEGTIIPGATVQYDSSYDNTGEVLHLLFSYEPAPNVEQILAKVSIPV